MPKRKCLWCGSKDMERHTGGYICNECGQRFPARTQKKW